MYGPHYNAADNGSYAQQCIQFTGAVQCHHVVTTADRLSVDKNLRHCGFSARTRLRLGPRGRATWRVDFLKLDALFPQQAERPRAIGAEYLGVYFDLQHKTELAEAAAYSK